MFISLIHITCVRLVNCATCYNMSPEAQRISLGLGSLKTVWYSVRTQTQLPDTQLQRNDIFRVSSQVLLSVIVSKTYKQCLRTKQDATANSPTMTSAPADATDITIILDSPFFPVPEIVGISIDKRNISKYQSLTVV